MEQEKTVKSRFGVHCLTWLIGFTIGLLVTVGGLWYFQQQTMDALLASTQRLENAAAPGRKPDTASTNSIPIWVEMGLDDKGKDATYTTEKNDHVLKVRFQSESDMKQPYLDIVKSGESCPGACSSITESAESVETQFEILHEIATLPDCRLTDEGRQRVQGFHLLAHGIENKENIDSVYHKGLKTCGLRYTGYDGYDVWLGNYLYKAVFWVDGLVVTAEGGVFENDGDQAVASVWKSLGSDGNSCDAACTDAMTDYFDTVTATHAVVVKRVAGFDEVLQKISLN